MGEPSRIEGGSDGSMAARPVRRCVGCGNRRAKSALFRIVRSPEGAVSGDPSGKAAGRGAYVCTASCFQAARDAHRFERALRSRVTEEEYDAMANAVASWDSDMNRE